MKIEQSALVNLFDSLILLEESKEETAMKLDVETIKEPEKKPIVESKIAPTVQAKLESKEEPKANPVDTQKEKTKKILESGLTMVFMQSPSAAEEELLQKILSNIKLNPSQLERIIDEDFKLNENIRFNHILSWGIPIEGHVKYEMKMNNGVTVLFSDTLTEISGKTDLKLKLWNCLKVLFLKA